MTEAFLEPREVAEHHHAAPHLSFLVHGVYRERIDGRWHRCHRGDVLVKPAGIPHSNVFQVDGCSVIVEVLDENRWSLPVLSEPRQLNDPRIAGCVARLRRELAADDPGSDLVSEGLVFEILGMLGRKRQAGRLPAGAMRRVVEFVRDGRRWPTLEDVARAAGMSPSRFGSAFRDCVGLTIGEFIRRVRVDQAATALALSALPISFIAADLGFSDQSHLTRLFKTHMGVTPAAFRRALLRG